MPKFVSGSSGTLYDGSDPIVTDVEDNQELSLDGTKQGDIACANKKPSAINRKDNKSKNKSKLESFKEELKRIQEEREERQRQKKSGIDDSSKSILSAPRSQPVPIPLKPDPRCPTPLTLAIKSTSGGQHNDDPAGRTSYGSHDNGDPTTTNVYLGNINPSVNENDLCDLFGKYGPLASIKVMWPRTEEEKARNRNCGFVAFMSRKDAERALKSLNGKEFKNYEMKLGKY